jgi:hypothetical protein
MTFYRLSISGDEDVKESKERISLDQTREQPQRWRWAAFNKRKPMVKIKRTLRPLFRWEPTWHCNGSRESLCGKLWWTYLLLLVQRPIQSTWLLEEQGYRIVGNEALGASPLILRLWSISGCPRTWWLIAGLQREFGEFCQAGTHLVYSSKLSSKHYLKCFIKMGNAGEYLGEN